MNKVCILIEDKEDNPDQVNVSITFEPPLTPETKEEELTAAQRLGLTLLNNISEQSDQ